MVLRPCGIVVLFITLLAAVAHAGETGPGSSFQVRIAPARTRLITKTEVHIVCRSAQAAEGCTEFLGETLRCQCRSVGRTWRMRAEAQLIPYMYVVSPAWTRHEEDHVADLREQISSFLTQLTNQDYDDAETCRDAAEFEATVFALRMDVFRHLSNRKLH